MEKVLAAALRDALLQLEGAFSLVLLSKSQLIVVRDPHAFRPMAMGMIPGDQPIWVFASETCAFDLVGASYDRDVVPGEMVVVSRRTGEIRSRFPQA